MAANKIIRFGPVAMGNSAANIINAPTITGGTGLANTNTNTYLILRHITIVNKTSSAGTFSLYLGATGGSAAGTEVVGTTTTVAANSSFTWYGTLRMEPADFLSGLANATTTLTFQAEGEIGIV